MKVVGISFIVGGVIWAVRRNIPYGWSDMPPQGHIGGRWALLLGLVSIALGIAALVYAQAVACIFWNDKSACLAQFHVP